jgi:hypothetical protein
MKRRIANNITTTVLAVSGLSLATKTHYQTLRLLSHITATTTTVEQSITVLENEVC